MKFTNRTLALWLWVNWEGYYEEAVFVHCPTGEDVLGDRRIHCQLQKTSGSGRNGYQRLIGTFKLGSGVFLFENFPTDLYRLSLHTKQRLSNDLIWCSLIPLIAAEIYICSLYLSLDVVPMMYLYFFVKDVRRRTAMVV